METTTEVIKLVVELFVAVHVIGGALIIQPIRNHLKKREERFEAIETRFKKYDQDLKAAHDKIRKLEAPKCPAIDCKMPK